MTKHQRRRCQRFAYGLVLLLAALISGCPNGAPGGAERSRRTSIVSSQEMMLQGRLFVVQALQSRVDGENFQTLQLIGDGIALSFHVTGGPFMPSQVGDSVLFGGQTIEAGTAPGSFVVAGTTYQLGPSGFYAFSDGEFLGRVH